MKFRCKSLLAVLSLFVVVATTGCKKDGDSSSNSYPKDVSIEYKVTNVSGVGTIDISYNNASGGLTQLQDVPLPWSVKFDRKVNKDDVIILQVAQGGLSANAKVKCDLNINGTLAASKTPEGSFIFDQVLHQFK
jgi:hypothetical protein